MQMANMFLGIIAWITITALSLWLLKDLWYVGLIVILVLIVIGRFAPDRD